MLSWEWVIRLTGGITKKIEAGLQKAIHSGPALGASP